MRFLHLLRSGVTQIVVLFSLVMFVLVWGWITGPNSEFRRIGSDERDPASAANDVGGYLKAMVLGLENSFFRWHSDDYDFEGAFARFKAENPEFSYLVFSDEIAPIRFGPAQLEMPKAHFEAAAGLSKAAHFDGECAPLNIYEARVEAGYGVNVRGYVCGDSYYYIAVTGVETSWPVFPGDIAKPSWFVNSRLAHRYFFIGGGLMLLAIGVLGVSFWSLRRTARVLKDFSPDKRGLVLSTSGAPLEVVPLINALNMMIRRVEEYEDQRDFFLATAAHEIRSPLNVVRFQLEELKDHPGAPKVIKSVNRLTTLTNQLLKLLELNSWVSDGSAADLVAACRHCIDFVHDKAEIKNVTITFDCPHEDWFVEGDRALIELALTNVLTNAVTFSPDGGLVTVRVDAEGVVHVTDEGVGVQAADPSKMFEPFAKFPPNKLGHGLGLAIVNRVVRLHHGDASLCNRPEGGAHATLRFQESAGNTSDHGI